MRTATAAKLLVPALVGLAFTRVVAFGRPSLESIEVRPSVTVYDADREQVRLVRWGADRFEEAGLALPNVEIHFHADASGCEGHLGYAKDGRVDVCTILENEMARRTLLHEMGHIWIDQNVSRAERVRFLELRDLRTWNASTADWGYRGYEQGAEIISWALGNRILSAQIPGNDPGQLSAAFELLSGVKLPGPGTVRRSGSGPAGSPRASTGSRPRVPRGLRSNS
jgi:hypothetical protein